MFPDEKQREKKALLFTLAKKLRYAQNPEILHSLLLQWQTSMDAACVSAASVAVAHMIQDNRNNNLKLNFQTSEFIKVCQHCLYLIHAYASNMRDREIGSCLWFLTKVNEYKVLTDPSNKIRLQNACDELCEKAAQVRYTSGQNLALTLWSMGKLDKGGDRDRTQIRLITRQIIFLPQQSFDALSISNLMWALSQLSFTKINEFKVIKRIAEHAKYYLDSMKPQEISNVMWGLKKLRYLDEEILQKVEEIIRSCTFTFSVQELTLITNAYADLSPQYLTYVKSEEDSSPLVAILASEYQRQDKLDAQSLCGFVYALSIAKCALELAQGVLDQMIKQCDNEYGSFNQVMLAQLGRAQLSYRAFSQELVLPGKLDGMCQVAIFKEAKREMKKTNQFANEVFEVIQQHYPQSQLKGLVYDNKLEVSIKVIKGDRSLGVACVSSQCFLSNVPDQLVGSSMAYFNMLKQLQIDVVVVRVKEWRQEDTQRKILRLIETKLQD